MFKLNGSFSFKFSTISTNFPNLGSELPIRLRFDNFPNVEFSSKANFLSNTFVCGYPSSSSG